MPVGDDLQSFMRREGWRPASEGPSGVMWRRAQAAVGVPSDLDHGSLDWQPVVERVAAAMDLTARQVEVKVAHEYLDEVGLTIENDPSVSGAIPLDGGRALLDAGWKMLRSAATTAQGTRARIGRYDAAGDEVLALAKMGHTRPGSFVIPVLMPIPRETDRLAAVIREPELGLIDGIATEPVQRRTMRTLGQALQAVQTLLIRPGGAPMGTTAPALIAAGVSQQFLLAVQQAATSDAAGAFSADFEWAGSVPAPEGAPVAVTIPAEAAPLLSEAADWLGRQSPERSQMLTGPIVGWHHEPGDEHGWVGVQISRKGREVVVHVTLDRAQLERATGYLNGNQTVVVLGVPLGGRGRPVRVTAPTSFSSLEEMMLNTPGMA